MTAEQLHDALGLLPSDLIEEADNFRRDPKKAPIPFRRWAALAACAVMVAGCGIFALRTGMLPLAGGGKSNAAMDKIALQECTPESPAAAAPTEVFGNLTDNSLTRQEPAEEICDCAPTITEEAISPTLCAPPVDMESIVYLRSDLPAVMVELLKTAEEAERFCTYYDEDWFKEFDLLLISLPGVGSLSDISVGQGSDPTHWQIRITEEAPAEDTLMSLIPVEKGHIPKDAEFELIWE